ncbi:hypothetical protein Tco_0345346 [Tanacetum coccineum]
MVHDEGNESSDAYCSSDDEELGFVDFHTEVDDNVAIKTLTTNDPFLNKLCSNNGHFRGFIDEPMNANDWNKMEPVLGMRFKHPEQLKLCLANYGVVNGYQLWYKRNDWRQLLVFYDRNVQTEPKDGTKKVKRKSVVKGNSVLTRSKAKNGEGVRDGWLAGYRKVIGLDGCFLKHTCKGELLVAMGRDANETPLF